MRSPDPPQSHSKLAISRCVPTQTTHPSQNTKKQIGIGIVEPNQILKHNKEHLEAAKKLVVSLYHKYLASNKVLPLLVSSSNPGKQYIGKLICGASDTLDCDMIIMGSRGLGKVQQFFMGSVSKFVVENSKCPVLIVKEKA